MGTVARLTKYWENQKRGCQDYETKGVQQVGPWSDDSKSQSHFDGLPGFEPAIDLPPVGLNGTTDLDRAQPIGWWAPVTLRHIKQRVETGAAQDTRFAAAANSTHKP
uniref:Uncharacterized protein n=1 Tax=Oryza sativa subsp. japonica TaxID=39947 RepID=Q33BB8_ORYSJ|nr:hypothetical protein LOC_Os10g03410 [Oryza sativa Japonica Group]